MAHEAIAALSYETPSGISVTQTLADGQVLCIAAVVAMVAHEDTCWAQGFEGRSDKNGNVRRCSFVGLWRPDDQPLPL